MTSNTTQTPASTLTFADMNLAEPFLNCITELGFTTPTPVQAAVIPAAMNGGDWIVSAQTGSGKTAAFLIPALQHIWGAIQTGKINPPDAPYALVICPTRELAQQVASDAINLVKGTKGLRIATVVGGTPYQKQRSALKGAQLVIATPGRLVDWVNQGGINLSRLHSLTLDEADRMLDLGFTDELNAINDACEHRSQTLMFSATFTSRETRLAASLMVEPQHILLASNKEKHTNITQQMHWADNSHHQHQLLKHWLQDESIHQAIIFASTQVETDRLAKELEAEGVSAASLHGAMPQVLRNRRLDALRKNRIKVLVATDVAARGIDVPTITHVFNYGLPMKAEDYVHRIGRTGRAGRSGIAVTFVQRGDTHKIREIEKYIERQINVTVIAGMEPQVTAEEYQRANRGKAPRGRSGSSAGRSSGGYRGGDTRSSSGGGYRGGDSRSSSGGYRGGDSRPASGGGYRGADTRTDSRGEGRGDGRAPNKGPFEQRVRSEHSEHNRFERRAEPQRAFKDGKTSSDRAPRREFDNRRPEFKGNGDAPRAFAKPASASRTGTFSKPTDGARDTGGFGKPRTSRKPSF
jgi:superfamily II DNA/RNA helicase